MKRTILVLMIQLIPVPTDHPLMQGGADLVPLPLNRTIERVSDYPKDLLKINVQTSTH